MANRILPYSLLPIRYSLLQERRLGKANDSRQCTWRSAAVQAGQRRLRQSMEVQVEANHGCGGIMVLGVGQLVDIDREHCDLVTVRLVAGRWTWTAVAIGAEIGSALDRPLGHQLLLHVARSLWQRRGWRGQGEDHPMPEATAGRRVRIVHIDGEALGAAWRSAPVQGGRNIAAGAAK